MNTETQHEIMDGLNLDDEATVEQWVELFGIIRGRRLANMLGFRGRGMASRANWLSYYAWNKSTAIFLRRRGEVNKAIRYEAICDRIYRKIHPDDRW